MALIGCCGFECLLDTISGGSHFSDSGAGSTLDTTIKRSGARALKCLNSGGSYPNANYIPAVLATRIFVCRFYLFFQTLPNQNVWVHFTQGSEEEGLQFVASEGKLYAAYANEPSTKSSSGISVTTGIWYRVDSRINMSANPHTIDFQINGVAIPQLTRAVAAETPTFLTIGFGNNGANATTGEIYFDDFACSQTSGDYPIGKGYVHHFIPTSDGTHNVAGANDFERSNTGTDITNATTDAFDLINDVPMKTGSITEYINLIAPPNATDYVEVVFGKAPNIPTPTIAPRVVSAIISKAKGTGTGTNNLRCALNDNGTLDDVFNGDTTTASPTASFASKSYADPPSAASAWTLVSGNGNFNNVRMRFFTSDAAPDPWVASVMLEAEFIDMSDEFSAMWREMESRYRQKPLVTSSGTKNNTQRP